MQRSISDFFSRSSFDQMIWKKFFSLIEFSINEKRTWFFCVIFCFKEKSYEIKKERKKRNSGRPDTWSYMDYTSPQFYSEIYVALVTLLAYPVSTCAAERSFSGMKRLKNPSSKHYEWGEAVHFGNTPHTRAQEGGYWPKKFPNFSVVKGDFSPFSCSHIYSKYTVHNTLIYTYISSTEGWQINNKVTEKLAFFHAFISISRALKRKIFWGECPQGGDPPRGSRLRCLFHYAFLCVPKRKNHATPLQLSYITFLACWMFSLIRF